MGNFRIQWNSLNLEIFKIHEIRILDQRQTLRKKKFNETGWKNATYGAEVFVGEVGMFGE